MIEQTSIFDLMHPEFQIDKPIRLIELFGGIGAQSRALELIGKPFESHRVVEWAAPSILAYNAIHVRDFADHTEGLTFDEVLERLSGVLLDYNKPATREQLCKRGEPWCRQVLSSMMAIKDYCPDVSKVKAEDLGIVEQGKYCYVLTYSFPCQDLSNAGKMAGRNYLLFEKNPEWAKVAEDRLMGTTQLEKDKGFKSTSIFDFIA